VAAASFRQRCRHHHLVALRAMAPPAPPPYDAELVTLTDPARPTVTAHALWSSKPACVVVLRRPG